MNYETILYDLTDGIAEIRLNRPQRLNAVTQQLYDELNDALTRAEADGDARVVLITGEGRAFTPREQQELVALCAQGNARLIELEKNILGEIL